MTDAHAAHVRDALAMCFGDSDYDQQTWRIVAAAFDEAIDAAAPVPCAASPADLEKAFKAGYHCRWHRQQGLYCFDPAMSPGDPDGAYQAWLTWSRATGEGARDDEHRAMVSVQSPVDRSGSATDSTSATLVSDRTASARDEAGQALPLQQLRRGLENAADTALVAPKEPRDEQAQTIQSEAPPCGEVDTRAQSSHRLVGDAPRAVAEPSGHNAPDPTGTPVAVSLGLPEALAAFIDVYDVVFDEDDVVMLQAVLAHLRGEATVRVEE
jgi:hypothetical protein